MLEHRVGDSLTKVNGKLNVLPEPVAGVSLRPNDSLAKKLISKGAITKNALVKATVPRWTGRKRKRGSDEPFQPASSSKSSKKLSEAPDLLRRVRDNESAYTIEPVGMIEQTHRFRSQPDYQMYGGDHPIMAGLRDHVLKGRYEELKKFRVDLRPRARDASAFPFPPTILQSQQPYRYEYQQAPNVVFTRDEHGNAVAENTNPGHSKRQTQAVQPDVAEVPSVPPPNLDASRFTDMVNDAIPKLRELLEKRPLVTRRVAQSAIPTLTPPTFFEAGQFLGYMFVAGPWRDVLIKYGVDPRSDPKYRFYQTMMIYFRGKSAQKLGKPQTDAAGNTPQPPTSDVSAATTSPAYIFDGTYIDPSASNLWQLCDITDSNLYAILHSPSAIRPTCDVWQWGWLHNGTMSKVRMIMRDKIHHLLAGNPPPEEDYQQLADIPDEVTEGSVIFDKEKHSRAVAELRTAVRTHAKGYKLYKGGRKREEGGGEVRSGTPGGRDEPHVASGHEEDGEADGVDGREMEASEMVRDGPIAELDNSGAGAAQSSDIAEAGDGES